jgi:predicted nucleotidyltransferase component of viral defense system
MENMNKWLSLPDETRRNACEQVAEAVGMSAFAVEKDWWITQILSIIFEMDVAPFMVFKGGTSLSKAWKLIERFSEDIDLAIDRSYFGFTGELTKKQKTSLRKAASAYTSGPFLEELKARFTEKGLSGVHFNLIDASDSDQDPRIIEVYYTNVVTTGSEYLKPKILIEVGCRSLREPYSNQPVISLIDDYYKGMEFTISGIEVPTVIPERTFLEKIFLLHEEFQRPTEKMRTDRLSRHLYDLYYLSKTNAAEKAINNQELYETIVVHRYKLSRVGGVNYNLHNPKTITPVPIPDVIEAWHADYKKMLTDMIYGKNAPTFEMLIDNLQELRTRLSKVEWEFSIKFPGID